MGVEYLKYLEMDDAQAAERWRRVSDTAMDVNLDAPDVLPYYNAVHAWQPRSGSGRGWIRVERVESTLRVGGREVVLYLDDRQRRPDGFSGHHLRRALGGMEDLEVLDPRIIDGLCLFEDLFPEPWKKIDESDVVPSTPKIFFWGTGYGIRSRSHLVYQTVRGIHYGVTYGVRSVLAIRRELGSQWGDNQYAAVVR